MNSATLLPPGWTEHRSPNGQPYYWNAQKKVSTYTRPGTGVNGSGGPEKPFYKSIVAGTEWFRVKTTAGNVFWFNGTAKLSTWIEPEEVKVANKKVEEERKKAESSKRKADHSDDDSDEDEDSEEEDWQKEAAAQLAAEAELEKARKEKEAKEAAEASEREEKIQQAIPERVQLSPEEGKALFKTLLQEKDINPLHPWDVALPKFVNDPRYVLLSSVAARREAFDEYCRDRLREQRQGAVSKEKAPEKNPKEEFQKLLNEEVKSTRASWTDFRRAWKKDRRFYSWGRDDREREKAFRDHVKQLSDKKRAAAQKAEADFLNLLKESKIPTDSDWKEVKKNLYSDPRYDAVGSSTLREELFNTYKAASSQKTSAPNPAGSSTQQGTAELTEEEKARQKKERKERAVKERERQVQNIKNKIDADIGKSRNEVYKEEGEREYRTMLTDAIRDPQMTWDDALPQLKTDPRFRNSPLPPNQQLHLFHSHIAHLRSKHIDSLHALFEAHAPTLAVKFADLPDESLLTSAPVTKLGYNLSDLKRDFDTWQRQRTQLARTSFDEMLNENSFVEFWGRLGKIGGEGVNGGVKADEEDEDEGVGGGGKVDMKELAKHVNVDEIEKVLKNDKRYINFDHIPEERTQWLRDYLSNLSAPRMSFHVPS